MASLIGLVVYWVLTGPPRRCPGRRQLALEAWIAGALVFLIVETGIF